MAKHNLKLARRYARALFESCRQEELETTERTLHEFSKLYRTRPELEEAFTNPSYPLEQRVDAARAIAAATFPGDTRFANFVGLLVDNRRVSLIHDITDTFAEMLAALKKILALEITSAFPISPDERRGLLDRIQREYNGLASVEWRVDATILGGIVVRAGDKLYDTSLRASLERAREELTV